MPCSGPARALLGAFAVERVGVVERPRVERARWRSAAGPPGRRRGCGRGTTRPARGTVTRPVGLRRLQIEDRLLEHLEERRHGRGRVGRLGAALARRGSGRCRAASRAAQARPAGESSGKHGAYCSGDRLTARGAGNAGRTAEARRGGASEGGFPLANRAENMDSTALDAGIGRCARIPLREPDMKRALFVLAGSSILAVASTVGVSTQTRPRPRRRPRRSTRTWRRSSTTTA